MILKITTLADRKSIYCDDVKRVEVEIVWCKEGRYKIANILYNNDKDESIAFDTDSYLINDQGDIMDEL